MLKLSLTGSLINLVFFHRKYIVIKVEERTFEAHKFVLSVRSPVFLAMFQTNLTERQTNTLQIKDIKPDVFAEVLRFLYTDHVENLDALATELLPVADKYMLGMLKAKCEASLSRNVTLENFSELLLLADLYSADGLKRVVLDFVRFRSEDVMKVVGWKTLMQNAQRSLLREILELRAESSNSSTTSSNI